MKKILLLLCMCLSLTACTSAPQSYNYTQSKTAAHHSLESLISEEQTERATLPRDITSKAETTTTSQRTTRPSQKVTKEQATNAAPGNRGIIVYWTLPNGKVYHSTEKCYHLSRSRNIYSGTIEEALKAGMLRPCEHCW